MKKLFCILLLIAFAISILSSCNKTIKPVSSNISLVESKTASESSNSVQSRQEIISSNILSNSNNSKIIMSSSISSINSSSSNNIIYTPAILSRIPSTFFSGKDAHILILGNSFINSSNVGFYISKLASEKLQNIEVTAISTGFYDITQYYNDIINDTNVKNGNVSKSNTKSKSSSNNIDNSNYIQKIKENYFDVIFLSGAYNYADASSLTKLLNFVENLKTKIVIFPADNENTSVLNSAMINNTNADLANWNYTIDLLKNDGFTKENLCNIDSFLHTNYLGGFVGACSIYSYLYNEKPESIPSENYLLNNLSNLIPGKNNDEKLMNIKKIEKVSFENYCKFTKS